MRYLWLLRALILFLCLWPFLILSQNKDYLPLTQAELGEPFTMKRLSVLTMRTTELRTNAGPSGSEYRTQPGKEVNMLTLQGQDKMRMSWRVDLFPLWGCAGAWPVFEADLDRDGVQDAVLLMPTCGNGLAPSKHIMIVTFDNAGRPIPFEAEGYFEESGHGIDALVDLNRDGRADLIFMNFNDGYWITNVYMLEDARWNRVQGGMSGRNFPLYTRFTTRANKAAVTPPPSRHPAAPELSNLNPVVSGKLTSWKWVRADSSSYFDLQLLITDATGKASVCTTQYWFASARIVIDAPEGRTIRSVEEPDRSSLDILLQQIVSTKRTLRLYGKRTLEHCSPELIWAGGV